MCLQCLYFQETQVCILKDMCLVVLCEYILLLLLFLVYTDSDYNTQLHLEHLSAHHIYNGNTFKICGPFQSVG